MTTKLMDNMNLNCAVKLLRYDDLSTSNNEAVVSLANNEPITEVKRSVRILSRKRTKPIKENGNQSDSVENKKCMIKKPKLSKIEPGNTDNPQKEPKTIKVQDSSKTSTESYLINDDLSVTSGSTPCPNYFIDDEEELSMQSSLKPSKIKISKSIICIKNKPIMRNINNDDSSNEIVKSDKYVVPLKSPKTKTPKNITSNKKKSVLSNVSKNNTSCELEESNSIISTKTPKNRTTKSITSNKKKSITNIINNVDVDKQPELEVNDNFAVPQVPKSKTSKSIVSNKKKPVVNNMNNSSITNEHKIESPRKRGRTSLKKEKCQKPDFGNMYNNEDNLEQTQNSDLICKIQYSDEKLMSSQNVDDNAMMLRSNNKPPKIKKKWSEEWSGDKLSTNVSKSNNEELSNEPTLDVNNTKMLKKNSKNQKSKNSNCKKVKTKMLQQFIPNNPYVFYTPTPAYGNTGKSSMNVPIVQNDGISITYHIPFEESMPAVCNDVVSKPVICNIPSSESSSNVSIIHTTGTESTFSNKNVQQSHLSTLEPISDSNYLSVSTISTENPEMSYGMAILSEAISRQSRELANEHIKKKSPEPDIKIQFSPKKTNSTLQSQVPSAMVSSPQRNVKHMLSRELKCTQFVEKELLSHIEHEINLLSKRFNISSNFLRRTVVDEPLSVFQKKYSKLVTPSAVEVTPIDVNAKSGLNVNYVGGNIDVEYKLDPIRESAAYEKYNLKDLMVELSKTMPSWSLSIVTNPTRYVISHMSIGMYGIPTANKCIVLDRMFKASVYINQSLEHKLCKRYTTATEIVNLIKDLNSI